MTPETAQAPQLLSNLPPGTSHWQWIFGVIVSSSFILYGLEAGWMSPMSIIFTSDNSPVGYPLSNSAISWLASIVSFVAAFTVPIFAHLTDDYGRKWVLLFATFPQLASVLLRIFFPNIIMLSIARALSGISASGVFVIVTVYLREISQHNIIAALGSLPVLMQNTGVFLIYLIGAYFDYFTVLWIMLVFPVSMIILLWKIPESPEFLVKEGLMDKAHDTVAFLRGLKPNDERVIADVEFLKRLEDQFAHLPKTNFYVIFKDKAWRKAFILIFVLFTCHAWNGAMVIVAYASTIVRVAEHGHLSFIRPELQCLCFPVVMITASLCFVFVAEKLGRRHLQAVAYIITVIALTVLGISLLLEDIYKCSDGPQWLHVLCMTATVAMYSGGIRPLPSIIITEMFSFKVRAKVMGVLTTYGWLVVSSQLFTYGFLVDIVGLPITFLMYAAVNLIGMIFALLLPETKGRTPEDIRNIFIGHSSPKN
ncbi:unnamed protein product [Pieris brassicae]|uniref:Major facilitator superfamily (MFS) profile domain-containing protein n=1 Tax=Pieris brassicae TaxID=7116 RepID=A0A9P0TUT1_PIEBR|nr:unnamed protein product [Pieris brassicae]